LEKGRKKSQEKGGEKRGFAFKGKNKMLADPKAARDKRKNAQKFKAALRGKT